MLLNVHNEWSYNELVLLYNPRLVQYYGGATQVNNSKTGT